MNHELANGMKMWKGNRNNTTLLFSLKGLEILNQERRGQVNTIVMEHFNSILFHKSAPANKQHTSQSIRNPVTTVMHVWNQWAEEDRTQRRTDIVHVM